MRSALLVLAIFTAPGGAPALPGAELPLVSPRAAGANEASWNSLADLVQKAIANRQMPGCVIAAGRRDQLFYLRAFGHKRLEPEAQPMETNTLFDLASLTKPLVTASSVMALVGEGKLRLDSPAGETWPEFAKERKETITVRQLLTHTSGLLPDNPLADYQQGSAEAWRKIAQLKPSHPPGERFVYSDVNFLVLGKLVELSSGLRLDRFAHQRLFSPLGMHETTFLPGENLRARAAPTERRGGAWLVGEVHDPRAHLLGGVAGHAGLFSSASDLAVFASALLGQGTRGQTTILPAPAFQQMVAPQRVEAMASARSPSGNEPGPRREVVRGLGWDMRSGYSSNRPPGMSDAAFGHGGFTGTVLWIDPTHDLFFIFLSNRLHPHGEGSVNALAGKIGQLFVDSVVKK